MKDTEIKDAMNSIEKTISCVYSHGYVDGIEDGKESVQIDETEAYKLGLETAWELARKLSNLGFNDTRKEIFGEKYGLSIDIIKDFSVDEVAAKIKEYDEKRWHEHKYALLIGKVSSQDFSVDEVADERRRGMTREEAIMVLKNEQPHCGKKALFPEEKKYEAYDVAIKALEHEPILYKIIAEIDRQEKWLLQAGYNAYNIDIAFSSIKSVLKESEDEDEI